LNVLYSGSLHYFYQLIVTPIICHIICHMELYKSVLKRKSYDRIILQVSYKPLL